jgi:hypothetical protein
LGWLVGWVGGLVSAVGFLEWFLVGWWEKGHDLFPSLLTSWGANFFGGFRRFFVFFYFYVRDTTIFFS